MSLFEKKEKLDSFFYRAFNLMSQAIFFFKFKLKRELKRNSCYKDLHKGQRCFILGAGPSLKTLTEEQQQFLKKEVTFGVNFLYKSDVLNIVSPTYYALFDNLFFSRYRFVFKKIAEKFPDTIFLTNQNGGKVVKEENIINKTIKSYSKLYPIKNFAYDLTQNAHITFNVVSECIKTAMYLGFKEIYLLGADYNAFAHPVEVHCYDDDKNKPLAQNRLGFLLKYYALTTNFHYIISKKASKKNISVINLTPNSLLDAYQKKNISDVLK